MSTNIDLGQKANIVQFFADRLALVLKLVADRRVNLVTKLIPLGALLYFLSPVDLIPLPVVGALDDAAIIWMASQFFIDACPSDVVAEHSPSIG